MAFTGELSPGALPAREYENNGRYDVASGSPRQRPGDSGVRASSAAVLHGPMNVVVLKGSKEVSSPWIPDEDHSSPCRKRSDGP